ncbi:MAG: hypothetical protein FD163_1271 [Hyphomonadaceae bacterium]|nr:MAG: hypothetical protein FD163_1271 [Hyphomonadaceae bacterium]
MTQRSQSEKRTLSLPPIYRGVPSDLSAIAQGAAEEAKAGGSFEAPSCFLTLPPFVSAQLDPPMKRGVASNVA